MKTQIRILLLLSVLLAACGAPAAVADRTSTTGPDATSTVDTGAVESTAPTAAPTASPVPATAAAVTMDGCTLQTLLAPPNATEVSRFPAPGDEDWQIGNQAAAVTIVEYGDFQ